MDFSHILTFFLVLMLISFIVFCFTKFKQKLSKSVRIEIDQMEQQHINPFKRGIPWKGWILITLTTFITLLLISGILPIIRTAYFIPTNCTLLEKSMNERILNIKVSYQVNNKTYDQWLYNLNNQLSQGEDKNQELYNQLTYLGEMTCWHDPLFPQWVILKKIEDYPSALHGIIIKNGIIFLGLMALYLYLNYKMKKDPSKFLKSMKDRWKQE